MDFGQLDIFGQYFEILPDNFWQQGHGGLFRWNEGDLVRNKFRCRILADL